MSKKTNNGKAPKRLVMGLLVIGLILAGAYAFYQTLDHSVPPDEKPPVTLGPNGQGGVTGPDGSVVTGPDVLEPDPGVTGLKRRDKVYTMLVMGADESGANMDVMMLVVFDTNADTMNVLHLPRDTYSKAGTNRKEGLRHLGLAYGYGKMEGLINEVKHLVGYEVDGYVKIKMNGFVKLINYIGGVNFNVPRNMSYSDPTQNLFINLQKGQQTLNGKKALELMRFRKDYPDGDIGRISVRSDFLKAAAEQILSKNNVSRAAELAGTVIDNVETSFSDSEILWFAKQAMELKSASIQFETMPGGPANNSGMWIPYKKALLALINEKFNPFDGPITYIDIVDRAENKGK